MACRARKPFAGRVLLSFLSCTLLACARAALCQPAPAAPARPQPPAVVRVAAVGGINEQAFWPALAGRFEKQTGIRVETVAAPSREAAVALFRGGGVDLITLQSGEAVVDLVTGGYARDPQPWVLTELILVGPKDDPAGVKGMTDASAAVRRVLSAKSPFVVHANQGADEVVRRMIQEDRPGGLEPPAVMLLSDHLRQALQAAVERRAYTLISAITFRGRRMDTGELVELVKGDPLLRRPFVLAVADPRKLPGAHVSEARRLAAFLRSTETQSWIDKWRPDGPEAPRMFFAVEPPERVGLPQGVLLRVEGDAVRRVDITPQSFARLERASVEVSGRDGGKVVFEGVRLRDVLRAADVPPAGGAMRGTWQDWTVHVRAPDGYAAAFALAELVEDAANEVALVADKKDGKPLPAGEGPMRLVVPGDKRPLRWVKNAAVIEVD